jgi:hypothetical protein
VFPWIKAGGPGRADAVWYGSNLAVDPSSQSGQVWNVFMAQAVFPVDANGGVTGAAPTTTMVKVTPHPMHYNDICMLGTACIAVQGNRNQADFFKLIIGKDGRARIIYTDSSNRLSQAVGTDSAADHQGAALDTVITQQRGLNAWTGKPLKATETTAPRSSITDPSGDALFKPLGGTNVPGADIRAVKLSRKGGTLVVNVVTGKGSLGSAAQAGGAPFAQLVTRWQIGDVLYYAAVEEDAASDSPRFYAGKTTSVDLCSVSGCKPNYLTYDAPPSPNAQTIAGAVVVGQSTTSYTLQVPLSAIGNPGKGKLLEEVMSFVTVSAKSAVQPLDNASAFADEVPLQIEGTKTFNFAL